MSLRHQEVVYPILFEEPIIRSNISPTSELFSIISKEGEGRWLGVHSNSMETKNYKQIVEAYLSSNDSIFEAKEQAIQLGKENQELRKENDELKEQANLQKKKMETLLEEFEVFKKEQTLLKNQILEMITKKEFYEEIQQLKLQENNNQQVSETISRKEFQEDIQQLRKFILSEVESLKNTIANQEKEIKKDRKMAIEMIPYYCEHMVSSTGNLLKKLVDQVGLDYFTDQSISEGKHLSAPITFEEYKRFQIFADKVYEERNAISHRSIVYKDLIKDDDKIADICKRLMAKYSKLTNPVQCSILNSLIETTIEDFQKDNFSI